MIHTRPVPERRDARRLGEILSDARTISEEQLDESLRVQRREGGRIGDILLSRRAVSEVDLIRALATQFGWNWVDLGTTPPDRSLLRADHVEAYVASQCIPWAIRNGELVVATSDPHRLPLAEQRLDLPLRYTIVLCSRQDLTRALQNALGSELSHKAVRHLAERRPTLSAHRVVTPGQATVLGLMALVLAACFWSAPLATFITLNAVMSAWFLATTLFKVLLVERGFTAPDPTLEPREEADDEDESTLPVYTILVPMYREPEVLPIVSESLSRLDYPHHKLDIKLVLEEDDKETLAIARALALPGMFEIVEVPASHPRTKPKACNFALQFARGDYLVIYDAEDRPDPDQLRKVLREFRRLPPEFSCIQARLNYFNAEENWITRMFTLEYTLLFDVFLPGLHRLGIPIPLGGTSNHFKTEALRTVGAWDPYNVTEDADLGVRLSQVGYRVGVINSTTLEEANCQVGNWIRQRSRWIKGYMQTWLVHMRDPVSLYRMVGLKGFIGFQLFVGGTIINAFGALAFWSVFMLWLLGLGAPLSDAFPVPLLILGTINFILCNAALVYCTMLAPVRRELWSLVPWALTIPAYWMLLSVAACKALWQLVTNPFHWEKTTHGISRFAQLPAPVLAQAPPLPDLRGSPP